MAPSIAQLIRQYPYRRGNIPRQGSMKDHIIFFEASIIHTLLSTTLYISGMLPTFVNMYILSNFSLLHSFPFYSHVIQRI